MRLFPTSGIQLTVVADNFTKQQHL